MWCSDLLRPTISDHSPAVFTFARFVYVGSLRIYLNSYQLLRWISESIQFFKGLRMLPQQNRFTHSNLSGIAEKWKVMQEGSYKVVGTYLLASTIHLNAHPFSQRPIFKRTYSKETIDWNLFNFRMSPYQFFRLKCLLDKLVIVHQYILVPKITLV